MGYIILTIIVAFLTMFVPGELLALALLRKTQLSLFEISVIGFIFGLIAPATLTWLESYAMNAVHAFTFSLGLFEANALVLTVVGLILCAQQGVFSSFGIGAKIPRRKSVVASEHAELSSIEKEAEHTINDIRAELSQFSAASGIIAKHTREEEELKSRHQHEVQGVSLSEQDRARILALHKDEEERLERDHKQEERILLDRLRVEAASSGSGLAAKERAGLKINWIWVALLAIMLLAFGTRMMSIGITPKFFEFDPYFDMLSTESILTFGYQVLYSPSAWPTIPTGTSVRIQPLVPYLEAYWYSLANSLGPHFTSFSTSLMSYVSGFYPPITAALLVFVVFMLLYYEYDKYIGLIGASLAATMPVLFTTFVSGEQLLEPWGIFTLFFFFAAYMLAIRNMKSTRLAILAGIAFASTFLGAHYYTVDAGVLGIYILIQGIISVFRRDLHWDFFRMNIIVIAVISIFLVMYHPYHATLSGRIPSILGIPLTVGLPIFALLIVAIFEYVPKLLKSRGVLFKRLDFNTYLTWFVVLVIILLIAVFVTPAGKPLRAYLNLSAKFTTPSSPLFMTVEEYIPTGFMYNFAAQGIGVVGASIAGVPVVLWFFTIAAVLLILIMVFYRNSKTGIFYLAIALPLLFAGFSEVKYLPHFGVAYIMLFGIVLGETIYMARNGLDLSLKRLRHPSDAPVPSHETNNLLIVLALTVGIFMVSSLLAFVFLFSLIFTHKLDSQRKRLWALAVALLVIEIIAVLVNGSPIMGESQSVLSALSAASLTTSNPVNACSILSVTSSIGYDLYCNVVPQYWLAATAWMHQNIGPYGPRVLSWWDYGDWINWFGNTNAVLRGDNANAIEDYATAASFVLGSNDSFGPSALSNIMNHNQTKYVLFDNQLVQKWQALDFLACVYVNATSRSYAIAQGQAQNPPVPFALGNSPCELRHDPVFVLVPLAVLTQSNATSLNYYCSISSSNSTYIKALEVTGGVLLNSSVCISSKPQVSGAAYLYSASGKKTNAVIQLSNYLGVTSVQGTEFVEYLALYLPNGPNDTITDAPTEFYTSNYYRGFYLGSLPGFTQVYPSNATGINYLNATYPIRIYELNNFTGSLPAVPSKPPWVNNNYSMP